MAASKPLRSPGRPKRNEQERPVEEIILFTAAQLFMEHGYEPISLQQIATLCGVTKASIYYYYENKPQLFTAAIVAMLSRARQQTLKGLSGEGSLRSRLETVAIAKMSYEQPHIDFETMMKEASPSLSEEQLQSIRSAEQAIHDIMAEAFQKSIDEGEMIASNPVMLSHAFSAILMIGNRDQAKEWYPSSAELAKAMVGLFWTGVSSSKV